ncbi:MAG: hypothetical protein HGB04_04005 [Chlorobiaceae bacterium]|nr:hypothetical protein [Chlorobiaceae bacterium]
MSFDPSQDTVWRFGADTADLESGAQRAANAIKQSTEQSKTAFSGAASHSKDQVSSILDSFSGLHEGMKGGIEGISGAFEGLSGVIGKFTGILAGGAALAESVHAIIEEGGEVRKLMNTFGMASDKAAELNTSLKLVGMSSDEYAGMAMKLDRQLKMNEGSLNKLGVATRDSNGNLLDQQTLMQNASSTMMQYEAGSDRNAVAMQLFGRNADAAQQLMKLNNDVMARGTELTEKLGLVMSGETLEAIKQYKMEFSAVKIVGEAFFSHIGEAMLPALTSLGATFEDIGVTVMPAFILEVEQLGAWLKGLADLVGEAWSVIKDVFSAWADAIKDVFGAIWPEAIELYEKYIVKGKAAIVGFKLIIEEVFEAIRLVLMEGVNNFRTLAEVVKDALTGNWGAIGDAINAGGERARAIFNEHLNRMKADAMKAKHDINAAMNGEEGAPATPKGGHKHVGNLGKEKKEKSGDTRMSEWEAELMNQQIYADESGTLHRRTLEEDRQFWENKLKTAGLTQKELQEIHKKIAQANKQELTEKMKDQQAYALEQLDEAMAAAQSEIAIEEEKLKTLHDLGQVNDTQFLSDLRAFEDLRYQIEIEAQEKRIKLAEKDPNHPENARKAYAQLLKLQQQYDLAHLKATDDMVKQEKKLWTELSKSISDGVGQALGGFIVGTKSWGQAVTSIFQSVQNAFGQMIGKMIAGYLEEQGAAILGIGVKKAEAATTQGSAAMKAADSQAGIPIIGPALAIAAFAGIMALTTHSAEGGFDIPAGLSPVTQLHPKEMVLPERLADNVRKMTGNGGGSGAQAFNINITAMDGQSVRRFFNQHKTELMKSLRDATRNGSHLSLRPTS